MMKRSLEPPGAILMSMRTDRKRKKLCSSLVMLVEVSRSKCSEVKHRGSRVQLRRHHFVNLIDEARVSHTTGQLSGAALSANDGLVELIITSHRPRTVEMLKHFFNTAPILGLKPKATIYRPSSF